MQVYHENYVRLHSSGNHQVLIISASGYGKSTATECITEEKHNSGYQVICPFDPKEELEYAFAMFPPEANYHVNELKRIAKPVQTKPVKIYHPFTFNLPKNKELYPMEIFTIPITDLKREEIAFLA